MTLDPYTSHWISQGSDDAGAKLHDADSIVSNHSPTDRDRMSDDRESDVLQAYREAQGRAEERASFDRSRPHREELTGRYGDGGAKTAIESFVHWDRELRENPHGAADALASHYLRQPPNLLKTKEPEKAETAPEDWHEDGKIQWALDNDVKRAWQTAAREKAENDEYERTREHAQLLRQQFPHLSFADALERITQIDRDLLTDPVGAAARLGASYGMPVTHGQVQAVEHQAQQQQRLGNAQAVYEQAIQTNAFPGLELPHVEEAVVNILHDPAFPRSHSGDPSLDLQYDLRNAHDLALQALAAGASQGPTHELTVTGGEQHPAMQNAMEKVGNARDKLQGMAAEKARKASRSISGSPSPGNSSGSRSGSSVEDDAAAAYRSLRATV